MHSRHLFSLSVNLSWPLAVCKANIIIFIWWQLHDDTSQVKFRLIYTPMHTLMKSIKNKANNCATQTLSRHLYTSPENIKRGAGGRTTRKSALGSPTQLQPPERQRRTPPLVHFLVAILRVCYNMGTGYQKQSGAQPEARVCDRSAFAITLRDTFFSSNVHDPFQRHARISGRRLDASKASSLL